MIIINEGSKIRIFENGKVSEDTSFKPYIYILSGNGEYKTIDGKRVRKIILDDPSEVYKFRKSHKVYEADIKYTVRYCIDKLKEFRKGFYKILFFDIEADRSLDYKNAPKPIISVAFYDNLRNQFMAYTLGDECSIMIKDWRIKLFKDEKTLIESFLNYIISNDFDILTAWNITYDINYLLNRAKRLGIDINRISRTGRIKYDKNGIVREIEGRVLVDLAEIYKFVKGITKKGISLDEASKDIEIKKLDKMKYLRKEKPILIAVYNINDVRIMVELDKKLQLFEFIDELRRLIGISWNDFIYNFGISRKRLIDVLVLRKAREENIVLPSSDKYEKNESFKGAIVLEPKEGIYENVAVLDVVSMYPNIIRTYNISYETLDRNGEILSPKGYRFRKEPRGLIPKILDELIELRKKYKEKMKKAVNEEERIIYDLRQKALKILMNSFYGVFGYKGFRLFKKEIAETVTAFGRELFNHIKRVVEKEGYKVIYGDTDSVFISFPKELSKDEILLRVRELIERINSSFDEFARRYGVEKHYHEIEFKCLYKRFLILDEKNYAGFIINEEFNDVAKLDMKGFIRGDNTEITNEIISEVLKKILEEGKVNDALKYLSNVEVKLRNLEFPIEKLVRKQSFDKSKEYKVETPLIKGIRRAIKEGIYDEPIDGRYAFIYLRGGDVIAVLEEDVKILEKYKKLTAE